MRWILFLAVVLTVSASAQESKKVIREGKETVTVDSNKVVVSKSGITKTYTKLYDYNGGTVYRSASGDRIYVKKGVGTKYNVTKEY